MFPDAELGDTSLRLMPGEALVLYTDGVTEARSSVATSSAKAGCAGLSSCAGCDAATLAGRIKGVVLDFQEATRATTSLSWSYAPVTERCLRIELG